MMNISRAPPVPSLPIEPNSRVARDLGIVGFIFLFPSMAGPEPQRQTSRRDAAEGLRARPRMGSIRARVLGAVAVAYILTAVTTEGGCAFKDADGRFPHAGHKLTLKLCRPVWRNCRVTGGWPASGSWRASLAVRAIIET